MNNGVLFLNIHPIYKNERNFPNNNAVLLLPKQNLQMIGGIKCLIDNKEIQLDTKEIQEEQQKQIQATDQNVISLGYQYFKIQLGPLMPGLICDLTIRMEIISKNIDLSTYQTIIPVSRLLLDPSIPDNFSFILHYNETMKISTVTIDSDDDPDDFKYEFNSEDNILKISSKPIGPIVILTNLENGIPNAIQSGMNDEYFIISILPRFLENLPKNDFIFITDCSGSMAGAPIRNVIECLGYFLHSLPPDCKFNIIRFGSTYECLFDHHLVDYNENNLQIADEKIKNMKADLAQTNLYEPLLEAYNQSKESWQKGKIVQMFTLTDGDISDRDKVFALVNQHRTTNHISSIGVGNGVDHNLVEGLAQNSNGSYDFVSNSVDISEKVINLLSDSIKPEMKNVSIKILGENNKELIDLKLNDSTAVHDGDMIHFTIKKENAKQLSINQIQIVGNVKEMQVKTKVENIQEYFLPPKSFLSDQDTSQSTNGNQNNNSSNSSTSASTFTFKSASTSAPKKGVEAIKIEKSLKGVVSTQAFDGKWNGSCHDELINILKENCSNETFDAKMTELNQSIDLMSNIFNITDDQEIKDIQSTVLAICILNIVYGKEKAKWALVEDKAYNWLKSKTQKLWPNEVSKMVLSFTNPNKQQPDTLLNTLEKKLVAKSGLPIDGVQTVEHPEKSFGFTISLKLNEDSPVETYAITLIENAQFINSGGKKLDLQKADIQNNPYQRFFFGTGDMQSCIISEALNYLVWDIANQSLLNPPEKIPVYAFAFHGRHNQNFLYKDNMIYAKQNGQVLTYVGGEFPFVMMFPSEKLKERQTFKITYH